MARPRTPIGTFGEFKYEKAASGLVYVRARYRDNDGRLRQIQASGKTHRAAERNLKEKLAGRVDQFSNSGEITGDSPFPKLVELWLEDLDLEGRLAANTRDLYEREMRNLVLPTFVHMSLREISVSRVDRFLKNQAKFSYSRAKQAKVVLSLALGLAVRYEAIARNHVLYASRLRRPPSTPKSLSDGQIQAIRVAVEKWRAGDGLPGQKPDGQLGTIIEVMLGTSARIGEVLAIRKCDVDVGSLPATVRICGTVVSPKGAPTIRQDHPKTSTSRRTVAVPKFTAEALKLRLAVVADEDDQHLVFFSRNHTPLTTNNVRRRLRSIMTEAKIEGVTPHAFRRTVATVLDRSGGTELAAEMLGHTSSQITRAHYIEKDERVNPITAEILEQLSPERVQGPELGTGL